MRVLFTCLAKALVHAPTYQKYIHLRVDIGHTYIQLSVNGLAKCESLPRDVGGLMSVPNATQYVIDRFGRFGNMPCLAESIRALIFEARTSLTNILGAN
jgi:hypothetical protein